MFTTLGRCLLPLGCALLAVALGWAFFATSSETASLLDETQAVRARLSRSSEDLTSARHALASLEARVEAVNREAVEADRAVESLLSSDPRLSRDGAGDALDREIDTVRQLVEARQAAMAERVQAEPPRPASPPAQPPRAEVDASTLKQVEERLTRYRESTAAIVSSKKQLGTGVVLFGDESRCPRILLPR